MEKSAFHDHAEHPEIEGGHGELTQNRRPHGDDRLHRPEVVADGIDDRERTEKVGAPNRDDLGDPPADVVADEMAGSDVEGLNELGNQLGLGGDGVVGIEAEVGTSAPEEIDGNDIEALRKTRCDLAPDEGVGGDAVDEKDRLALA